MTLNLPTPEVVIPLYEKHGVFWEEEEYLTQMVVPRACASGICLVDKFGLDGAEAVLNADLTNQPDTDTDMYIAASLEWPMPFLTGVLYGNDGDEWDTLIRITRYQTMSPEEQQLMEQGFALGRAVRNHFHEEPEEDGDEGW